MAAHHDPELVELKRRHLTPGRVPELYDVGDVLGKGGFATVRVGRERAPTSRVVAIKIVNPKISADPRQQKVILEEVDTMVRVNALGSGNLLRFVAAHEDFSTTTQSTRLTIVSELCSGGELFDRIVKVGHYDEQSAAALVSKLAHALHALHSAGIIHRDIKPENILYASKDDAAEPVIADFGLAKPVDKPEPVPALVGTPGYLSPEIIKERRYTPACDVWALGVITYILLCGYPPFYAEDNKALYAQIARGQFYFHDEAWSAVSDGAKDLVRRMLTVDYRARITLPEVLAHPWTTSAFPAKKHLSSTITNLKRFNARRKIKAAAMAAAWLGRVNRVANTALAGLLGSRVFSAEESERLSAAFRDVAGPRGTVNLEQFRAVLAKLGEGGGSVTGGVAALPAAERMFELFDRDGSGDIDLREFLTALARLRGAADTKAGTTDWRATLKLIFDIYDADGSGALSPDELVDMLLASGMTMLTAAADAAASAGDGEEGAGSGGGAGAAAVPASPTAVGADGEVVDEGRAEAIANIFSRMDADGDGSVTFDEFLGALEAVPAIKAAILAPLTGLAGGGGGGAGGAS